MLDTVIRSPAGTGTGWPSPGRQGGQNCDGALVCGKAPIETRSDRSGGSKHHPRPRPTDHRKDTTVSWIPGQTKPSGSTHPSSQLDPDTCGVRPGGGWATPQPSV